MRALGPTFGGINLEDIKAPECVVVEERLRELLDVPVRAAWRALRGD